MDNDEWYQITGEKLSPFRFVVYKKCDKGWKVDEIFEDEDDAINYVDEYKEELELDDTSIKYVHEELTEEEFRRREEENA
jgi:hypothetical protein